MKSFKLHGVLDYRKRCEDEAHKKLYQCIERRSLLADEKSGKESELQGLAAELHAAKIEGIGVQELLLYEECIGLKTRELEGIKQKLLQAEAEVKEKRAELVKARQEKRALEILKEKRDAAERLKERQQENKFLDEVSVLGFGGRR